MFRHKVYAQIMGMNKMYYILFYVDECVDNQRWQRICSRFSVIGYICKMSLCPDVRWVKLYKERQKILIKRAKIYKFNSRNID